MKKVGVGLGVVLITLLFSFSVWAGGITILRLPGVGSVAGNPAQRHLIFSSYGGPMEFSVCWNELRWNSGLGLYVGGERCVQGEVGGWAKNAFRRRTRVIRMPHYRTFTITIGRYSRLAVAICRENDGRLGCVRITH